VKKLVKLVRCASWSLLLAGGLALAADTGSMQAKNPRIPTILSHFKAGKLEAAESELNLARKWDGNTSVDLGQLSILEGMIRAVSADDEQARACFRRALALDPNAQVPTAATARIVKIFDGVRAEVRAGGAASAAATAGAAPASPRDPAVQTHDFVTRFEDQYAAGNLQAAGALLDAAGARKDMTELELGQIELLKAVLAVLRDLEKGGPLPQAYRSLADDFEAAEVKLAEAADGKKLGEMGAAQFLAFRSSLRMVCGVLRAEFGEADRARVSFRKALELNPKAKLPAMAPAGSKKLFNESRGGKK
jgi:hypothetical protein